MRTGHVLISPEEHRYRRLCLLFFVLAVCWFASLGGIIGDLQPPAGVVLYVLLPCVMLALVLIFPGRTTMSIGRRAGKNTISVTLCWLVNAMAYIAMTQGQTVLNRKRLLWIGIFPSAALFIAAFLVERDWRRMLSKPIALGLLLFLTLPYGYVAVRGLNSAFDPSPAVVYRSGVVAKHYGSRSGYFLEVEPWGPIQEVHQLEVDRELYRAVRKGGPVCMSLHQGAFKVPWYAAEVCPEK